MDNPLKKAIDALQNIRLQEFQSPIAENFLDNVEFIDYEKHYIELTEKISLTNTILTEALEKSWPERHPFWFGTIMAIVGGIVGAASTMLLGYIFQT